LHDETGKLKGLDYYSHGTFTPPDVFKIISLLEKDKFFKIFELYTKSVDEEVLPSQ